MEEIKFFKKLSGVCVSFNISMFLYAEFKTMEKAEKFRKMGERWKNLCEEEKQKYKEKSFNTEELPKRNVDAEWRKSIQKLNAMVTFFCVSLKVNGFHNN